jgi:TfoX/Sxy family transcriptional regulator of competence genes
MPFNEKLADRVRELIAATTDKIEEKKMFGGLCFMVDDKMCAGVKQHEIMVRVGPDLYEELLEKEGVRPMIHGERTAIGYLFVDDSMLATKQQLQYWIKLALDFNKFAKSSKKK